VCLAGLRERHLGELEGKTVPEAKLQCPRAWEALQAGSFSERIPVRRSNNTAQLLMTGIDGTKRHQASAASRSESPSEGTATNWSFRV